MFIEILSWMLAHTPAFLRPGVTWLITGINRIVNHVSSRWNRLGTAFVGWAYATWGWRDRLNAFVRNTVNAATWLKTVFIPRVVNHVVTEIRSVIDNTARWLHDRIVEGLDALRAFTQGAIDFLRGFIQGVLDWASHWVNEIRAFLDRLVRLLVHVLNGPEALAEWLVAAMWKAFTRYMYSQRDRIASWVTRESVVFTRWLAVELENIIMRWL